MFMYTHTYTYKYTLIQITTEIYLKNHSSGIVKWNRIYIFYIRQYSMPIFYFLRNVYFYDFIYTLFLFLDEFRENRLL